MAKAIFFDIDGTLREFGGRSIRKDTKAAPLVFPSFLSKIPLFPLPCAPPYRCGCTAL